MTRRPQRGWPYGRSSIFPGIASPRPCLRLGGPACSVPGHWLELHLDESHSVRWQSRTAVEGANNQIACCRRAPDYPCTTCTHPRENRTSSCTSLISFRRDVFFFCNLSTVLGKDILYTYVYMYTIYFYTFDRPLPGCVVCVQQCKLFLLAFFFFN